jgi:hypothetical protein
MLANAQLLNNSCLFSKPGTKKYNTLGQFTPCGKQFSTMKEQSEHIRSHVRFMKKPDSTLSCFFGDCAKMPTNPSSARDRDGPTIVSETDQLQHIWQQH